MDRRHQAFAIKAAIADRDASAFAFIAQKTMYGGKRVAAGDRIFLFASGNGDGDGLFARGTVDGRVAVPRTDEPRQTPRVSITVQRTDTAIRPLGRAGLRAYRERTDAPEHELDFKLYRQATDKIVGLSAAAAECLDRRFAA